MNLATRKLRLIEAFSSLEDVKKIEEIESILLSNDSKSEHTHMVDSLSGAWSIDEAEEMKRIIEEGCEKIDESEW